jgi:hypothetical protein
MHTLGSSSTRYNLHTITHNASFCAGIALQKVRTFRFFSALCQWSWLHPLGFKDNNLIVHSAAAPPTWSSKMRS